MKIVMSWLREVLDGLPPGQIVADALTRAGFEVEAVTTVGTDVSGVVVGEVLAIEVVEAKNKNVNWVQVDVGGGPRGVICGAFNFSVGDRVAVALPGAELPGGFAITARKTYGHVSDGMICSARELGVSDEHDGILVLPPGTPLGSDVVTLLGLVDEVLDLEVTQDRGYALSVRGIARELATAFALPFLDPASTVTPSAFPSAAPYRGNQPYPVTVSDPLGCDRYVARVVTGLDPSVPSPLTLQRRLSLSGVRSISLAVDVTNIVLLGLGQPMHAFDRAKLSGPIDVRRARPGERLVTLDGVDRTLDPEDLVIADASGPIALAGVMGGAATEISASTREIVLESAHFDAVTVARTARRHRLQSEASRRYERGVDPALAPAAAEVAAGMLASLGGATVDPGVTDVDLRPAAPEILFHVGEVERLGGRTYSGAVVRRRLADVGCEVSDVPGDAVRSGDAEVVAGVPPSWRPDLTRPADLVEEVIRLEGYDTIPVTLPRLPAGRGLTPSQRLRRQVGRALAHAGYAEVLTVPFVPATAGDRLGLPADDPRRAAVRLANPIAEDAAYLRTSLLPGLLAAAAGNAGRGETDLALSECGAVFLARAAGQPPAVPAVDHRPSDDEIAALDATLPDQPLHVGVFLAGLREPAGWWGPGRATDWGDAVEAAHVVARACGVELTVARADAAPWHPGRCASLSVAGHPAGFAGELHPRVVAEHDLPSRSCAMELDLGLLLDVAATQPVLVAPVVSPYPPADRDVALVVADDVPVAAVTEALRAGAGPLLERLRLFDVYTGDQLGAGRRSLAFGLRLRAGDRTLTAEEANAARDAAVAEAGARTGATLRS